MKKRLVYIVAALLVANAGLFMASSCSKSTTATAVKSEKANIEEIVSNSKELAERHDTECYYGGKGSKSCSIPAGIEMKGGVSIECSVTCNDGYYACCGLSCICRPEDGK